MCLSMGGAARACGRVALACVKYGCVVHCVTEYVADIVVCTGPSMEPTILSHDVIVTDRWTPLHGRLRVGDIVVARSPADPCQNVCKRITATAGQPLPCVSLRRTPADRDDDGGWRRLQSVPPGHVWLEGDNSANSNDSRSYGPVPCGLVLGRAICKLWPPLQGGLMDGTSWLAASQNTSAVSARGDSAR